MPRTYTRRDPVADKNALLGFLSRHPTQWFAAGDLRLSTTVPKNHVRGHLTGESNVEIKETPRKTLYRFKSSASPKR